LGIIDPTSYSAYVQFSLVILVPIIGYKDYFMKNFSFLFSFILAALASFAAFSQQEYSQDSQQVSIQETKQFSKAELAQMLAPIALYPDSLLTHVLIASTYPIEIVEAYRWVKKNDELNSKQIAQSVEIFEWDASVKALVPFERILSRLSEDLTWMQQLGDAFLQDETRLLESIQTLREQAKLAGNLDKMENMDVSYEDNNIIIEPLKKEVVYVPYYDTRMVYGNWHWSSYPPVYWTPYSRAYVSHYSPFYYHSGIHISFNYFFSAFHWHNRHVVVVNPHRSHRYRSRRLIARGGYAKRWSHQPVHRKGVAYRTKHTSKKYYGSHTKKHQNRKSLSNAQRDFKQHLSSNKHFSSKKKTNKGQVRQNGNLPRSSKQYSANVKYKEYKKHKESKKNKELNQQRNVKKVTSKKQKYNTSKPHDTPKERSKHSNRKQPQQIASEKKHTRSRQKSRN
jgi:hypothetical protein